MIQEGKMQNLRNKLSYLQWALFLLRRWVRYTVNPKNLVQELDLKENDKVCYIVRVNSLLDLLVLWEVCERNGLPLPHLKQGAVFESGSQKMGTFVSLRKETLISVQKYKGSQGLPFLNYLNNIETHPGTDIKLVPVSIFWGRNPGRDEKSLMKLLFLDDEHAGFLQKIFIFFAQGRSTFVSVGKPISIAAMLSENRNQASGESANVDLAKKITRVLKIHFRLQRNAVLGPQLPHREQVIDTLLRSLPVKSAIEEEARKKKMSYKKAESKARKYMWEIISNQKYSFIRTADIFFTWFWNRIFNGVKIVNSQVLREIDPVHEIVYLPSHRSHMDYLLLAYVIYYEGMVPPHTAAGVNLNFWPVGGLLRMGGAFYLRRTFSGNRLYATVFSEYVQFLVAKGHPIKFYLEGGRSRTGRLLPGKTGLLSMIVQSYLERRDKPIVFVPIYVGYDKVMEVKSYHSELQGAKKKSESVSQLIKARSALKTRFGKAYIGFGQPIYLKDFLNESMPDWDEAHQKTDDKPKWLSPIVSTLAEEALKRINQTAIVSPMGLFALTMLSIPSKALPEEDLVDLLENLRKIIRLCQYNENCSITDSSGQEILNQVTEVFGVKRFKHPSGDVIYLESTEVVELGYYKNNIMHLLALPALIAAFFNHNTLIKEDVLKNSVQMLYPFLFNDLHLQWKSPEIQPIIAETLEKLVEANLLIRENSDGYIFVRRPEVISNEMSLLRILAGTLGTLLERYCLCTLVLLAHREPVIRREEFEKNCVLMARKIAILGGTPEAELFEKSTIGQFLSILVEHEYLQVGSDEEYQIKSSMAGLEVCALSLLSYDMRQGLMRVANKGPRGSKEQKDDGTMFTIN